MKELVGMGVALVTPFTNDNLVDVQALTNLVEYQIKNGVDYLVILGTTAETATLSSQEKELVKTTVVRANKGRLPLVLGIGGNNTAQVIEEITTTNMSDFDAILSVSPYYNKPTQQGIYLHFKTIAQATEKPIILYNVPSRTGANMAPKTVLRLANEFSHIVAVKEAAGNMTQALELLQNKPKNFLVISGDDMLALPMTSAGGSGVISVIGQGYPKEFSEMIQLALQGKITSAYAVHYHIMDSIFLIFKEGNPAGIKVILEELNICNSNVRLPLVAASQELRNEIRKFMTTFKDKRSVNSLVAS